MSRARLELLAVSALVVVLVASMAATRLAGQAWGDDFALYVHQADALVHGDVAGVRADNDFMLDHSENPDFSPPTYPWGFPLLLAIPVAVYGLDFDALTIVGVLGAAAFLVGWYAWTRRRLPAPLPLLGTAVLGLSPVYAQWSDALLSELPFMAVVFATLWWLDRCRGRWLARPWWPGAVAGLLAAVCFSTRREGLAMLVAVGAAQIVALVRRRAPPTRDDAVALLTPYAAFVAAVGVLQLVLPSTLVPRYGGSGPSNITRFADIYLDDAGAQLAGRAGGIGLALALLAVVGIAGSRRRLDDVPAGAYLVVVVIIGTSFPIPSGRYIASAVPIALLFAIQAVMSLERWVRGAAGRWVLAAAVTFGLSWVIVLNGRERVDAMRSAERFNDRGSVLWGPDDPAAGELFDAVDALTAPDDVIGFFKARALTLLADRRALQVGGNRSPHVAAPHLDYLVLQLDDTTISDVRDDPARFEPIWSNSRFQMWRVLPTT